MLIEELRIAGFRNLQHVELGFGPGVNALVGRNGSGKTSVLEAIHVLSRGRSFRSQRLSTVVQEGQDSFVVFARVREEVGRGEQVAAGYEFSRSRGPSARLRGEPVRKLSDLASVLPVVFFGSQTVQLLSGPPQERRGWMDWGVFHVEHDYLYAYQRYERALKQCNAALRGGEGKLSASVWYREMAEAGLMMTRRRRAWIDALIPTFHRYAASMATFPLESPQLHMDQGWRGEDDALLPILEAGYERDAESGFVQRGPHRADFALHVGGRPAREYVSAGQMKVLATALTLAAVALIFERAQRRVAVLLDDLPAELDESHRATVMGALRENGNQVLVTATDRSLLSGPVPIERVFHVEQGRVTQAA